MNECKAAEQAARRISFIRHSILFVLGFRLTLIMECRIAWGGNRGKLFLAESNTTCGGILMEIQFYYFDTRRSILLSLIQAAILNFKTSNKNPICYFARRKKTMAENGGPTRMKCLFAINYLLFLPHICLRLKFIALLIVAEEACLSVEEGGLVPTSWRFFLSRKPAR